MLAMSGLGFNLGHFLLVGKRPAFRVCGPARREGPALHL